MFIELVERLRCVREHELTWLVALPEAMVERDIVRGTLGCPICRASYPIAAGVANFALGEPRAPESRPVDVADEAVARIAALLDLTSPGGFVMLAGAWTTLAAPLAIAFDVHVLALDPVIALESGGGVSIALAPTGRLPVRPSSLRGVVLDDAHAELAAAAADALLPRGRLIAPASTPLPNGIDELARDESIWVAERDPSTTSAPVPLRRRGLG